MVIVVPLPILIVVDLHIGRADTAHLHDSELPPLLSHPHPQHQSWAEQARSPPTAHDWAPPPGRPVWWDVGRRWSGVMRSDIWPWSFSRREFHGRYQDCRVRDIVTGEMVVMTDWKWLSYSATLLTSGSSLLITILKCWLSSAMLGSFLFTGKCVGCKATVESRAWRIVIKKRSKRWQYFEKIRY